MTKIKILFRFFSVISFCLCLFSIGQAVQLTGYVKSKAGKPISGVEVLTYATMIETNSSASAPKGKQRHSVKTDVNGFFALPNHGQIVHFRSSGLRPLSKVIDLKAKELSVIMEDFKDSLWEVPICSSILDKSNRNGHFFKLLIPKNIKLKKEDEPDGEVYFFGLPLNGQVEVMVNWSGASSLEPDEMFLLGSKEFFERIWKSGNTTGYEIRGVKSDGKWWRRISFNGGAIAYQGNSENAAKIFDSLLDNMCFEEQDKTLN
jgi:hypothetical protein